MAVNVETALALLKTALGITHSKRDSYYTVMLASAYSDLRERGIALDLGEVEDNILLADYAEFNYRNRDGGKAMPLNLDLRLRNRKAKGRANRA